MSEAHDVGPLAEEAAKLLGALSGWARDHAVEASDGLSGVAARAASAVQDVDEHLATGAGECTVCPLCRTINAVRQVNPEVTTHLASAVTSLVQAASALMSAPSSDPAGRDEEDHVVADDWPESDDPA